MAKVPGMGGAFDLRQLRDRLPRTFHETTFFGCQVGMDVVRDDEGKVRMYQLKIVDPAENHIYTFGFEEKVRQEMIAMLMDLTLIGEVSDG